MMGNKLLRRMGSRRTRKRIPFLSLQCYIYHAETLTEGNWDDTETYGEEERLIPRGEKKKKTKEKDEKRRTTIENRKKD